MALGVSAGACATKLVIDVPASSVVGLSPRRPWALRRCGYRLFEGSSSPAAAAADV